MNRNLKIISIFMVLVLCLSFSASAAGDKVKTKDQIIQEKIQNKDFVKYQQWHDKTKFDREVAGNLNLKVQSTKNKVPDGFEPAPDGYQTMVSYKNNGKIHIRDTEHKVETIQVPWNEITALPGFDGSTVLITHYNDFGIKDGVWVQEVYNIDGFCYLEEIPFSEVVVSGFTGVYQFTPAGNFTASDTPGIGYTFDSDFVNYFNASFETIYDDTDPYPQYTTDGLVGWWRFDEGTGTLVQDFSGNGNNGTAQNGMGWTDGQIEGAGDFDGSDDYVEVSDISITTDTLTVEFWISPEQPIGADWGTVLGNITDRTNSIWITIHEDPSGEEIVFSTPTSALDYKTDITYNEIQHVAITYDENAGTDNLKFYVDGTNTDNFTATENIFFSSNISIGDAGAFEYNGVIDNLLIFDRILSPTEIATNYQIGYNEYFSKDDPYDIPTRGLVGWWRFDEGSGTNVSDSSGNGNHGTMTNGNWSEEMKYNSGGDFDGINDLVDLGSSFTFEDITISTYFNTSDESGFERFVARDWANNNAFLFGLNGKTLTIQAKNSTGTLFFVNYDNIVNQDELNSATFMYDSNANTITLYYNGVFVEDAITVGELFNSTGSIRIGETFNGTLDNVLIYNRTLSEEEIEQLYYIKTSQLATRTNSNSTYSGFWNNSTDNPISVLFGAGESISSLRFDNTSSIVQNGITIYEPENMLFNLSVEVGHTENTTNIYEELNGDSYQVFIQHIPGVDSVSGTVEFTSDPNAILSSPYLTTGMDTNNTNASLSYNTATRVWTVTTGPVVANQTYNYILYGVLEGSTLETVVEGGFGNDNMEAYTAIGNNTVIVGSVHTASTLIDEIWGNEANDLAGDTGGLIILSAIVGVIAIIIVNLRGRRE